MHYGRKAEKKIKKSLIKSFQLEQNPGQCQLESRDQKPTPSIKCLQSKRDPCSPKYSVTLGELISPKHIKMPLILIRGATPLYNPYKYVPPGRVGVLGLYALKTGIHFAHLSRELRECMNVVIG